LRPNIHQNSPEILGVNRIKSIRNMISNKYPLI
jgi:hypothetical protein